MRDNSLHTDAQRGSSEKQLRFCRRATKLYLLFLLTVYPLFTGISGYNYLHLKKFLLFALSTVVWTLCLLVSSVRCSLRGGRIAHSAFPGLCLAAFAAAAAASTILARGVYLAGSRYDGLATHLLYVCVLWGVGEADEALLWAFAAAYTLCCGVALAQLLGWNALWLFPGGMNYYSDYVQEVGRFLGTVGNIDVLSALHCLALPLFAAAIVRARDKRRFLLLVPLVLGLTCQIWAHVASGLLALGVTAALALPAAYVYLRRAAGAPADKRVLLLGPLALIAAALLVYCLPPFPGAAGELRSVLHGEIRDEFGSHRILIWRETVRVIREHPLLGVGPENLAYWLDVTFERYSPLLGETLRTSADNAHNEYLQLAATFGLCGAVPATALGVCALRRTLRRREHGAAVFILTPCLLCYLTQAFFNIGLCIVTPLFCAGAAPAAV